jgi:hypothetical protein
MANVRTLLSGSRHIVHISSISLIDPFAEKLKLREPSGWSDTKKIEPKLY